jgi:hypothetical protein
MKDLSTSGYNNASFTGDPTDLITGNSYAPLLFPSSKTMEVLNPGANSTTQGIMGPDILSFAGTLEDYEFFYIFPIWPDSLSFPLREVVVNSNSEMNSISYPDLALQEF